MHQLLPRLRPLLTTTSSGFLVWNWPQVRFMDNHQLRISCVELGSGQIYWLHVCLAFIREYEVKKKAILDYGPPWLRLESWYNPLRQTINRQLPWKVNFRTLPPSPSIPFTLSATFQSRLGQTIGDRTFGHVHIDHVPTPSHVASEIHDCDLSRVLYAIQTMWKLLLN